MEKLTNTYNIDKVKRRPSSPELLLIFFASGRFTQGFMMEMLQLKMLKSQKSFLRERIKQLRASIDAQARHETYQV